MAQLLATDRWVDANSVGAYLREALSDDFIIVANCTIARYPITAIVLSPTALTIIYTFDDAEQLEEAGHDTQAVRVRSRSVLNQFLDDEFPTIPRHIREIEATRDWSAPLLTWQAVHHDEPSEQTLADALLAAEEDAEPWVNADQRETLAAALRDRQLSSSQRASRPFVFRSGDALHSGWKAWTIRDVVAHMDRRPEDGMHHLRDGTLAAWLEREGALHMAQLARSVVSGSRVDMRIALESFLHGTGLVERPRIDWRPKGVDLGYALKGDEAARTVRLRKGKGRGFLYGEVSASEPWLNVEPRAFREGPVEIVVTADTEGLPITGEPHRAHILVASSASSEPIPIPVTMRVVALPAPISKGVIRPLAAMVLAALIGFFVGWLWQLADIPIPASLSAGFPEGISPWPWLVGGAWGLAGLARGLRQAPAWPISYAARRWLARVALYAASLGVLGLLLASAWLQVPGELLSLPGFTRVTAALVAASLAFLPATLKELENSNHAANQRLALSQRSPRRAVVYWSVTVMVLLAALAAPRALGPVAQRAEAAGTADQARGWAQQQWTALGEAAGHAIDRITLDYYGR